MVLIMAEGIDIDFKLQLIIIIFKLCKDLNDYEEA